MIKDVKQFFVSFLLRIPSLDLSPSFKFSCFLDVQLLKLFMYYFRYQTSIRHVAGKNLFLFCNMPLHPYYDVLCYTEASQFCEVPFINCSQCLCFGFSLQKVFSCVNEVKAILHFLLDQVQCIWTYAEVLDPIRIEFFTG